MEGVGKAGVWSAAPNNGAEEPFIEPPNFSSLGPLVEAGDVSEIPAKGDADVPAEKAGMVDPLPPNPNPNPPSFLAFVAAASARGASLYKHTASLPTPP